MKLINPYIGYREPVYQNHFVAEFQIPKVIIDRLGGSKIDYEKALSIACYKFTPPTVSINNTTLDYINFKVNYATGYELGDISTGFYNFNMGKFSVRTIFLEWALYIVNWQTGEKGYAGSSNLDNGDGYKTKLYLYELNPDGITVQTAWLLLGAFPTSPVADNTKDWSSKEPEKVDITWKCDTFFRVVVSQPASNFDWKLIKPDE